MEEEQKIHRKYEWLENGNLRATVTYPSKEVVMAVQGKEHTVGHEHVHSVVHEIYADSVPILRESLQEQLEHWTKEIEASKEREEQYSVISDKLITEIKALQDMRNDDQRLKKFKLGRLDELARKINEYLNARTNVRVVEKQLKAIQEQLDVIDKKV